MPKSTDSPIIKPKSRIGIAVWGIGGHARRTVLPAIEKVPDLDLIAIGSRDRSVVEKEAKKFGCCGVGSLQQLIEFDEVDVVFVSTPIGCHATNVTMALAAGKHVWCEKAFTQNLDEAYQLVEMSREKDTAICVSCPPLHHPLYDRLIMLLEKKVVGKLRAIDAHFGFPHVEKHSKYDPDVGGGALLDVGFYPLVVGSALMTECAVVTSAVIETETGFGVDTAGTALLRFPSGVHLTGRWGYGRDYINELRVFGETGEIRVSPVFSKPSNRVVKMEVLRQNKYEEIYVPDSDQFVEMLHAFIAPLKDPTLRDFYRERAFAQQKLISDVQMFQQFR